MKRKKYRVIHHYLEGNILFVYLSAINMHRLSRRDFMFLLSNGKRGYTENNFK